MQLSKRSIIALINTPYVKIKFNYTCPSRHHSDLVAATGKPNFTQTHTHITSRRSVQEIKIFRLHTFCENEENVPPRLYEHPIKIFSVECSYRSHFNYPKHYQCYRILVPYKVLAR